MGVSQLSRRQGKDPLARRAGLRVAACQEEGLGRMLRQPAEEQLAAIYRREATLALQATGKQRSWMVRAVGVATAACLLVAVLFVVFREPALKYEVAGRTGAVGEWVAADSAAVALDFSDGSRVDVQPGARARVAELGDRRAGIMLERGELRVHVVPREARARRSARRAGHSPRAPSLRPGVTKPRSDRPLCRRLQ